MMLICPEIQNRLQNVSVSPASPGGVCPGAMVSCPASEGGTRSSASRRRRNFQYGCGVVPMSTILPRMRQVSPFRNIILIGGANSPLLRWMTMTASPVMRAALLVSIGALFGWAQSQPPGAARRIYVEPFAAKPGTDPKPSQEIRQDVIAQLRKLPGVILSADAAGADELLTGRAEVWIQGYRSLNPRSGRLPGNGVPVYSGFLSVELKTARGETQWSYLAAPGAASEDVNKELAKKMVRQLAEELPKLSTPLSVPSHAAVQLTAAGATFPFPIYSKWFESYKASAPGVSFTYEAVGSEAGIRKLLAGGVDFGASDCPVVLHDL